MGLTGRLMAPADSGTVERLCALIDEFQPTLVVFPALKDRHPDHGAAHVMTRLALARATSRPEVLAYLVHKATLGGGNVENIEVQGTSAQRTAKREALEAYVTQLALSGGRMRRMAGRTELYAPMTTPTPWLPWRPPAWLRPFLRLYVAGNRVRESWRWLDAPLHHDPNRGYRLELAGNGGRFPLFVKLAWDLHTVWIFDHWGWCEIGG